MRNAKPIDRRLGLVLLREKVSIRDLARALGVNYYRARQFAVKHGFAVRKYVRKAVSAPPPPPPPPQKQAAGFESVYTCAKCGRVYQVDGSIDRQWIRTRNAYPILKRTRIGGRWWCEVCAGKRFRARHVEAGIVGATPGWG